MKPWIFLNEEQQADLLHFLLTAPASGAAENKRTYGFVSVFYTDFFSG